MIEAVIELQRNMMDVEALARESHVNPLQTGCEVSLETHKNEDVCIAVSHQLWNLERRPSSPSLSGLELNKHNIPFPF